MKTVCIIRGPSGSGKSTFIRNKWGDTPHGYHSADLFFIRSYNGELEYKFDPTKIGQAHAECMRGFLADVVSGEPLIVVDNTFVHAWEWINYSEIAKLAGYDVEVYELRVSNFEQARSCARRNVHGVPASVIYTMACEFEPFPRATVVPFERSINALPM